MPLDQESITHQRDLLGANRRNLTRLLEKAALSGGEVAASLETINLIEVARQEIVRIKEVLRENGIEVEDEPNDEAPPWPTAVVPASGTGDYVGGDKVGADKIGGDQRKIDTGGGDYAEKNIDKRQGTFIGEQHNYYQADTKPLDPQQQRNRSRMLDRVESFWVRGVLEQSLYQIARIELGLELDPEAVAHPWETVIQRLNLPKQVVPSGKLAIEVFDELGGEMLILGAPGAGKTTLLLELARDLIARARQHDVHPIPAVFNLSTWATRRPPLDVWLEEELNQRYDVPRKVAQEWLTANAILPLLDGLDEVSAEHRAACVDAINGLRSEQGFLSLAVCSRAEEYQGLREKLCLESALVVQPLTPEQVSAYLKPKPLAGVRTLLRDDPTLRELLDTPLMVSIVVLAYKDVAPAKVRVGESVEARRARLLDDYIAAMFVRPGKSKVGRSFPPAQIRHWLSWLAFQMVRRDQTVFYIERMQPDWLQPREMRSYSFRVWLLFGLLSGLIFSLVGAMVASTTIPESSRLTTGLAFGLFGALLPLLLVDPPQGIIESVEIILWRFSSDLARFSLRSSLIGAILGAVLGGFGGFLEGGSDRSIVIGLIGLLSGALVFGVAVLFLAGLSKGEFVIKKVPNQGIRNTVRNIFVVGLSTAESVFVLVYCFGTVPSELGDKYTFAVLLGAIFGLFMAIEFGGRVVLRYYALRWTLWNYKLFPLRDRDLIPFLDYCAERIFLRKVGGGYIFIHRLLLEHFASLHKRRPEVDWDPLL